MTLINNGNCTEWSAIWAEIIRMISKSNERAARVQFEITSMISDQNCTTQSSITTFIITSILKSHNLIAQIQEMQDFGQYQYFLNQVATFVKQWLFFCLSFFCNVIG